MTAETAAQCNRVFPPIKSVQTFCITIILIISLFDISTRGQLIARVSIVGLTLSSKLDPACSRVIETSQLSYSLIYSFSVLRSTRVGVEETTCFEKTQAKIAHLSLRQS